MSIELTTASKSTRLGVSSALNAGILGLPSFDGVSYADKAEVIWSEEATEGISIPDGASDTFTKTYALSRSYPNGAFVHAGPGGFNDYSSMFPFLKIAQVASTFPYLSASGYSFKNYVGPLTVGYIPALSISHRLIFVTADYTQATKLNLTQQGGGFPTPLDANGNQITQEGFGLTYSQLTNNCLIGTYGGPFGGGNGDSYLFTTQVAVRFVLQSAYLDGTNLKFLFKKQSSSDSATLGRQAILVVDANV
jgi:hypothetical protein